MRFRRAFTLPATAVAVTAAFAGAAAPGFAAGKDVALPGSTSPAAQNAAVVSQVSGSSAIDFTVDLRPNDLGGARAFALAVSTPGNAAYGHYLTPAQWEAKYSPTAGQVAEVEKFLTGAGFKVSSVSPDRMTIDASGSAAQVEKAFGTSLSVNKVDGKDLRVNDSGLKIPAALAGVITAIDGVTQTVEQPADYIPPPPPAGFRAATPCGKYFNQLIDTQLPPFGNGYPANPPWAVCGYVPSQFRAAYNENPSYDGTGVSVAIVDAYVSPTLLADAQKYASINDPSHPLTDSQFTEVNAPTFNHADLCGPSGWYGEQTLDVEAVHAMAPGAHIVYAGAENCFDGDTDAAIRRIVDGHLATIITNSYGDPAGDAEDPPSIREATDNLLMMATGTGVSVLFSSGDWFDNYTVTGLVSPTYPADSPWATGVGGTTTAINGDNQRIGEYGWSTARSMLCTDVIIGLKGCTDAQKGTWLPIDLALDGGSGGGTSSVYPQPSYQAGVVPTSLSEMNGDTPMRVEPDISMDADPATGMLVGETQTFPDGVYYDQYRIGGTSLASPLLAGYIATAEQQAGHSFGLLNPALYAIDGQSGGINDVQHVTLDQSRADYVNGLSATDGRIFWTRIIDYEGPEQHCTTDSKCDTIEMTLHATPGYDNMTGLGTPGPSFLGLLASIH